MKPKNRQNQGKHGISFETATLVFEDPHALSDQDRDVGGEERWQTIGNVGVLIVLVAHLWWDDEGGEDVIRIISARKASLAEKKGYEAHKKSG